MEKITFEDWLVRKPHLVYNIQHASSDQNVFNAAKEFYQVLASCGESEEAEVEKRSYGLAPPERLRVLISDSDEKAELKRKLWKCYARSYCSHRETKNKGKPMVLIPIQREDHWAVLQEHQFPRLPYGEQFMCLMHLREPTEGNKCQRNSYSVLQQWFVNRKIPEKAFVSLSTKSATKSSRKIVTSFEKDWQALLGISGSSCRSSTSCSPSSTWVVFSHNCLSNFGFSIFYFWKYKYLL